MKGWETRQLGEVCEMINRGIAPKYVDEGGVCVINQKCIRNHVINFELARRHDIAVKSVNPERYIQIGDVLVNSTGTGTLGRVAQVRKEPTEITTVDTHVTIVRPHSGRFFNDFFGYMLVRIEDEISSSGEGASGQTELARSTIAERFKVSFPNSISEQKRIVSIVDEAFEAIDIAIDNTKQNLTNARELFDSYLNAIFTQKGDEWKEKKLDEIGGKVSTGPFGSLLHKSDYIFGGIPIVNPANIEENKIIPNFNKTISPDVARRMHAYILKQNDVVVGRRGEIGRCAVVGEEEAGWLCGSGSFFINPFENVNSIFLAHLIRSVPYRSKLEELASGATMLNLSNQSLSDLVIAMPSIDEQNQITNKLDDLRTETQRLEAIYQQKLTALNELKQSILHKAFTGELTVATVDLKTNIEKEAIMI